MIKACLNGGLARSDHPAVPLTPAELSADAVLCANAGAAAVHVHPRSPSGAESLDPADVGSAVAAIRTAVPGLPIGVSTGAWIVPDLARRLAAIGSWSVLPDLASVNVHETGSADVAALLHDLGVGVEAGVWSPDAALELAGWRTPIMRILIEPMDPAAAPALETAGQTLAALRTRLGTAVGPPVLLHGQGRAAWAVLREALRLGLDVRVGLEDTLELPDRTPAPDNVSLVAAAAATAAATELGHGPAAEESACRSSGLLLHCGQFRPARLPGGGVHSATYTLMAGA